MTPNVAFGPSVSETADLSSRATNSRGQGSKTEKNIQEAAVLWENMPDVERSEVRVERPDWFQTTERQQELK